MPKATPTQTAQKAAMTAWRDALLVAADLLADQGKITEAKDKLAEFRTGKTTFVDPADSVVKDVQLNAATDTAAKDFAAKIATFAATDLPILRLVEKLGLPQPNPKFQPKYEAAKKKGYETQTWVDAKSDLAALAVTLQSYKPVVEAYQKLVPVLAVPAVASAVTLMKSDLTGGWNYGTALGRLNGLAQADKENAAYETRRAALTRRVNGTVAQLAGPAQARIEGPWDAAPGEPDHAKKMLKLAEAEGFLADADAMILAREAARAQKARLDAGDVYGLMTDAVAKEGADTFANAKIAYDQAVLGFGRLAILLGKVEKLVAVKDGLAKTAVVALKTITDALAAADIKAKGRLWDDADVALAPAMALPLVQSVSSQIGLYLDARNAVEKRQVRLASDIADPVAKKAFEDPWNAAIAKAETDHDYVKAIEMIEAHKPVMAEVQAYAGAATRARKGLASMKRIETQALPAARKAGKRALLAITPLANAGQITVAEDAAALAKTNAIYPMPNSKAKLDNDLSLAEVEAGKGNFTAAKGMFEAICLAAKVGMAAAAAEIEALDDGHYVEAHGPGVTDPQHKLRLTTGMRPDGKKVATTNTSQFGDVEDMLAAREVAVAELAVKHPATTGVSVSAGDNLEYVEISEFEVPVGKSFKSDCMKKEFKAGEFKESDLCENYREYGPLTRVFTKMIFLFDDPDTARPIPRRITSFVDVNKHRATVGGVFPAAYPGRWAVHQHYPTPDNFDPDKGEYVD